MHNQMGGGQAHTNGKVGAEKAKEDLEEVKKTLLQSIQDFQKQSANYSARLAYSVSKEKFATMLLIVFGATVNSLQEQIKVLQEAIERDGKSSDEQTQQINELQGKLTTSYKDYSGLKQLESLFQWWQEIFDETIMKNEDERAREEDVTRRKRRR